MDVGTPSWLSTREQRAWRAYLAMQAGLTAELNRRLQVESGLSLSDFDVLVALTDRRGERIRVGELSAVLHWEKSRLSHHLTRMQRRGLVARVECPDDGRGAELELTEQGREPSNRPHPVTSTPYANCCSTASTTSRSRRSNTSGARWRRAWRTAHTRPDRTRPA